MAFVIAEPCVGVKSAACVDVCPVDCIHPTPAERGFRLARQLYIDPETCIDCGHCVPLCPVEAIFPVEELPEHWEESIYRNSRYYWNQGARAEGFRIE